MPFVKIDNTEFEVPSDRTVLEVALDNDIEIPHYCYHPSLEIAGSCRMCLVQIEGMSKLQVSCNTFISEAPPERKVDGKYDMVVHTKNKLVTKERKNILEFLLLNHPLDCPVCDQAGECYLQDYSFKFGNAHSRFDEEKRVRPNEYLGSQVAINHNRCILCSRCTRFTREISGTNELYVEARGYNSKIAVMEENPLDNLLAGNVTDICPVGALLSTDYIHKNRIWNLKRQPSVCQDCSVGCNIDVFSQKDKIIRLTPRENHKVNGYFMCDIGRYGFHKYENIERITSPLHKTNGAFSKINWDRAIKKIVDKLKTNVSKTAAIASSFHTNETNYMLGRFFQGLIGTFPSTQDKEITYPSGFRISGDRSPNKRGMNDLCPQIVKDLPSEIKKQKIRGIYILDNGIDTELDDTWKKILDKMDFVIVQSYIMTPLAKSADIILPGLAPFESEGTITNDRGHVQWLRPSLPVEGEGRPDWEILNLIDKTENRYIDINDLMKDMGKQFPSYSDISLFKLGDRGISLSEIAKS
jgi:NADH-quinone oxidoreductase subunit G